MLHCSKKSIEVAIRHLAFKPSLLGCEISEVQFRKRTESGLHYKRVSLCGNWIFIQSPIELTLCKNSSLKIKMLSQQFFVIANRGTLHYGSINSIRDLKYLKM